MTLTVGDLRAFVTSSLTDPALQALLNASYEAILSRSGGTDAITEFVDGGYSTLILSRPAGAITSLEETIGDTTTTLAVTDYRASGYVLTRLDTGTNPRTTWGTVEIAYTPLADTAERDRVAIELVKLDLNYRPGLIAQGVEGFSEQYPANSAWNYEQERASILATLGSGGMVIS